MTKSPKLSPSQAAKALPRLIENEEQPPGLVIDQEPDNADRRPAILEEVRRPEDVVSDLDLERALAGTPMIENEDTLIFVKQSIRNVRAFWRQATQSTVEIAIEIANMEGRLGGAYEQVVASGLLPFAPAIESKLRTIGRAILAKRLPSDGLPGYTLAYEIAKLPEPALQQAQQEGLVRPDVTRQEILTFVRRYNSVQPVESLSAVAKLAREREALNRRKARLQKELADIEARLDDIRAVIAHRIGAGEEAPS